MAVPTGSGTEAIHSILLEDVANTAIGDTTEVASNNMTTNWAAHFGGKSVNLRKILA